MKHEIPVKHMGSTDVAFVAFSIVEQNRCAGLNRSRGKLKGVLV